MSEDLKPVFFYVDARDLAAARADEYRGLVLCLVTRRRDEVEDPMVRVALVEVPGSAIDKAWDQMTDEEKDYLSGGWGKRTVPDARALKKLADRLTKDAERAMSAAEKLREAAKAVALEGSYRAGPNTHLRP